MNTVIGWSKRYLVEDESDLKSKRRDWRHLSVRTLSLPQEWQFRSVNVGEYLLCWEYMPLRLIKRALKQNSAKVELYWADETAVGEDRHWLRGYALAGLALKRYSKKAAQFMEFFSKTPGVMGYSKHLAVQYAALKTI